MLSQKSLDKLKTLLYKEEDYRQFPYKDTKGILTIGIGRNLQSKGLSKIEAFYLLENDINEVYLQLKADIPWITDLDETRQAVLIDMAFNMGEGGVIGFKNTLNLISEGKYKEASEEMLKSKWALEVGNRAIRLSEIMRTGQWI